MLKKRKEREITKVEFNPDLLLDYNEDFLLKNLKILYPVGTIVDQTTAYTAGLKSVEIKSNLLEYSVNEKGTNIAFGGVGIWHSKHKKLAKIISDV